ncbi:MAG: hypothetical protein R2873_12865 [Caldilineaceae bacterium]|nr:hypothetical protein [Caldilineaceae bacterium]
MPPRPESYRSYLLRLRRVDDDDHPRWCYTLESPDGVERHEFWTLQALTAFLAMQTDQNRSASGSLSS